MKKTLTAELFLTSLNNDSELIHFFIKKLKSTGIQVTSYPSGNNEILNANGQSKKSAGQSSTTTLIINNLSPAA